MFNFFKNKCSHEWQEQTQDKPICGDCKYVHIDWCGWEFARCKVYGGEYINIIHNCNLFKPKKKIYHCTKCLKQKTIRNK